MRKTANSQNIERIYANSASPSEPRVHLLIVQATPFCNLKCRYCYLTDLSLKARISERTIDTLFGKLFQSGWVQRNIDVCWHAGEPTSLDMDFYRRAQDIIERHRPRDVHVQQSLQTNATLLTKDWCDFFRQTGMHVGVSIDGPQRINDINRLTRSGRSAFSRILAGVRLLQSEKIPFHAIAVLSKESLRCAPEIYQFFAEEGIKHVAFNIEESEGEHVSELKLSPQTLQAFKGFFAQFAALAASDGRVKTMREWDSGFQSVFHNRTISPGAIDRIVTRNVVAEPFGILSVDHRGAISTFSPELLGNKNDAYDDYIIGNVNTHEFADLPRSPALIKMNADIQAGVEMCREQCAYFDICRGGQPINKISENGTFASAATSFCRMTRMAITDLVMSGPYGD